MPGFSFAAFVAGRPPSTAHPEGTALLLGQTHKTRKSTLLELDLATFRELRRVRLPPVMPLRRWDRQRLTRAGGAARILTVTRTHAGVTTVNPETLEARTVVLEDDVLDPDDDIIGFGVFDEHILIVATGVRAYLFAPDGRALARHRCKGAVFQPGSAELIRAGRRVAIANIMGDGTWHPCAFSLDGKGGVVQAERELGTGHLEVHEDNFVWEFVLDDKVRRADAWLRPFGPAFDRPKVAAPFDAERDCPDMGEGRVLWSTDILWRTPVVLALEPVGVYACPPVGRVRTPR